MLKIATLYIYVYIMYHDEKSAIKAFFILILTSINFDLRWGPSGKAK